MYAFGLRSSLLIGCAALVLAVGCGRGNQLDSPTSPTAAAGLSAAADDDGLAFSADAASESEFSALDKGGHGHDSEKEHGRSHEGRVVGFVGAKGADTLTVRGMTIKIQDATLIRHGHRHLTIADIDVGDHVQARGSLSDDKKTLTATEVKVENTGKDNDDDDDEDDEEENEVELKGTVSDLSNSNDCPSRTFKIGTTTVRTNNHTRFDDVTCNALASGNIVEVDGTKQSDGSILAELVELESGPNDVEGTISGLTGTSSSCPNRSFTIGSTTVMTNNSTSYDEVACATLANGMKVEVEGTLSGSTLTAARIEKE